jgi:hypothetical protein
MSISFQNQQNKMANNSLSTKNYTYNTLMTNLIPFIIFFLSLSTLSFGQPGSYPWEYDINCQFTLNGDTIPINQFTTFEVLGAQGFKKILAHGSTITVTFEGISYYGQYFLRYRNLNATIKLVLNGDTMVLQTSAKSFTYPFKKGTFLYPNRSKGFNPDINIANLPKELFNAESSVPIKIKLKNILYSEECSKYHGCLALEQDYYGKDSIAVFYKKRDTVLVKIIDSKYFGSNEYYPLSEIDLVIDKNYSIKELTVLEKDTVYLEFYEKETGRSVLLESNNLKSKKWIVRKNHKIHPNSLKKNSEFSSSSEYRIIAKTNNGYTFRYNFRLSEEYFYYRKNENDKWHLKSLPYPIAMKLSPRNTILWLGKNRYSILTHSGLLIFTLEE